MGRAGEKELEVGDTLPRALLIEVESRNGPTPLEEFVERINSSEEISLAIKFVPDGDSRAQGLCLTPDSLPKILFEAYKARDLNIAIGIGQVEVLQEDKLGGEAIDHARDALQKAKKNALHFGVVGENSRPLHSAIHLQAALLTERSNQGWEVADLKHRNLTGKEIAAKLNVSAQAVSQRLQAANFNLEQEGWFLVEHLAAEALRQRRRS